MFTRVWLAVFQWRKCWGTRSHSTHTVSLQEWPSAQSLHCTTWTLTWPAETLWAITHELWRVTYYFPLGPTMTFCTCVIKHMGRPALSISSHKGKPSAVSAWLFRFENHIAKHAMGVWQSLIQNSCFYTRTAPVTTLLTEVSFIDIWGRWIVAYHVWSPPFLWMDSVKASVVTEPSPSSPAAARSTWSAKTGGLNVLAPVWSHIFYPHFLWEPSKKS